MAAAVAHGAAVAAEIIRDPGGRDRTGREAAAGHPTLRILFAAVRTD
ncbi:hypothetical protein RsS62_44580 [Rhizobium dioscoreae]|nr:hypothetical protein RsS62_44580 [Rhizobium dioscoreae]